ncbi:MAG: hypothetical protein ACOCXG_00710 [Nanoarchaeota archaeon]
MFDKFIAKIRKNKTNYDFYRNFLVENILYFRGTSIFAGNLVLATEESSLLSDSSASGRVQTSKAKDLNELAIHLPKIGREPIYVRRDIFGRKINEVTPQQSNVWAKLEKLENSYRIAIKEPGEEFWTTRYREDSLEKLL